MKEPADPFRLLASRMRIIIEKRDSDLVPYHILSTEYEGEAPAREIQDELGLLETEHIPLPEIAFTLEVGDRLEFVADFFGHYYSYMTDCGTEHDADFEFRDVSDIMVWRVVHEQDKEYGRDLRTGADGDVKP